MKTMSEYQRLKGSSPLHIHTHTSTHTHPHTHPHTHTHTHTHTHCIQHVRNNTSTEYVAINQTYRRCNNFIKIT
jgi:hypothetical protein